MTQQFSPATPRDHLGRPAPQHGYTSDDPGAHQSETQAGHASPPMWRRLAPLAVGGFTVAATLAITWWNPSDSGAPLCPSKFMFGVDCPFCGTTRATAALARGDLARALDHNVMWVALVPVIVVAFAAWTLSSFRNRPMPTVSLPRWLWIAFAVAFVAFGVTRNLDVSAFTRWLGADAAAF